MSRDRQPSAFSIVITHLNRNVSLYMLAFITSSCPLHVAYDLPCTWFYCLGFACSRNLLAINSNEKMKISDGLLQSLQSTALLEAGTSKIEPDSCFATRFR